MSGDTSSVYTGYVRETSVDRDDRDAPEKKLPYIPCNLVGLLFLFFQGCRWEICPSWFSKGDLKLSLLWYGICSYANRGFRKEHPPKP